MTQQQHKLKFALSRNDSGNWTDSFDDEGVVVLRSTEQTVSGGWQINSPARLHFNPPLPEDAFLKTGDIVITKSSGSSLHIGKASLVDDEIEGMRCTFSNFMQRLRCKPNFVPRLVWYFLNSADGRAELDRASSTTTGLANLNGTLIGNLDVSFPLLAEQRRIAGYLDEATGKIDRLLGRRRRQMELLQEQRAALIQQAVTRGLNPNAPLKPSGLQWLGDVPKHWEVIRLGRLAGLQGGYAFDSRDFGDEGVPVVRMNNLKRGHLDLTESAKVPSEKTLARFALRDGDILFGMSGSIGETGSLGNFASVSAANLPLQLNQRVGRFVLHHRKFTLEFLRLLMQSNVLAEQILQFVTGTAQFNISSQQVENVVIAVPPANEQIEIAKLVRHQEAKLDNLHLAYTRQLELLAEYRAALIHECVTGQRVVPGGYGES